jgi:putative transposase
VKDVCKKKRAHARLEQKIYPYLLPGLEITEANHVWTADICYLPLAKGFCYFAAIM